jgi:hypothetical protein
LRSYTGAQVCSAPCPLRAMHDARAARSASPCRPQALRRSARAPAKSQHRSRSRSRR